MILRRLFLKGGALAPLLAAPSKNDLKVLDYGLSFISGKAEWNAVRFWVESRTRIIDDKTGKHEDYYQCGACKSENTFAPKNLFITDNYDFTPIFGPEYTVLFRRKASLNPNYMDVKKTSDAWGGLIYRTRDARSAELLVSNEKIRSATHAGWPLVAQTEISNAQTGLRAIIEYPVKTMNIEDRKNIYQVDTGPVAYPDLSRRRDRWIDSISLAYVAFNVPGFADFVIEAETPVTEGGREVAKIRHYSRLVTHDAKNRLYGCRV